MSTQPPATFGSTLRNALQVTRMTQAELAHQLHTNPAQVSRWARGRVTPHVEMVRKMEMILGCDLLQALSSSQPDYELYLSTPIVGLNASDVASHRAMARMVYTAAIAHAPKTYWAGEYAESTDDLIAADIATKRNMQILARCSAFLYLQLADVVRPTSALIELGIALGMRLRTTVIVKRGIAVPYMLEGFPAVAADLKFLPQARVYTVNTPEDAAALLRKNGRELLGLDA